MEEHYCNKCFKLIKTGIEHQDWCPKKPKFDTNDFKGFEGTIFEDLINKK